MGDDTPIRTDMQQLNAEQSTRVTDWLRLARVRSRAFGQALGLEPSDLHGAAYLGLCLASLTYRPETEVPFGVWARLRIDLSLRAEVRFLRDGHEPLRDELPIREPEAWPAWLESAWAEMRPDRRELVDRRLRGESLASIGRHMGLTHEGVRLAFHREIGRLRAKAALAADDAAR
jgi:hypothetical protein